ncbi:hypothetical protein, partial [Frankia sp. CiP3]|uniref:hypothetical protein n=1 Tax=Frankia sp. CiP3 TaxID=2880971 RepID=UPI001EF622BE
MTLRIRTVKIGQNNSFIADFLCADLERPRIGLSGSRLPASRPAALSSVGAQHQGAFLRRLAGSGADEPLTDRTPYP